MFAQLSQDEPHGRQTDGQTPHLTQPNNNNNNNAILFRETLPDDDDTYMWPFQPAFMFLTFLLLTPGSLTTGII